MNYSTTRLLAALCFLLMSSQGAASSIDVLLDDKKAICLEVFNKLKLAKGLIPSDDPKLELVPFLPDQRFAIALFQTDAKTIFLQEKTYDICMTLMEQDSINGLAFILAHELAHYFKKHNVRQQFISNFQEQSDAGSDLALLISDNSTNSVSEIEKAYKEINTRYTIRKNEAEADLEAGFMSYLAGYKSIEAGPKFLDLAYQVYDLKTQPDKYASLAERQEIVKKTGLKLDTMIHVFETANLLSSVGEYEYASNCYKYISNIYQSKEILNNMAVLNMLTVASDISRTTLPYVLPITLEVSLIEKDKEGPQLDMNPEFVATVKKVTQPKINLLDAAYKYLEEAYAIDPNYVTAGLNKSICQILHFAVRDEAKVYFNARDYLIYAKADLLRLKNAIEESGSSGLSKVFGLNSIIENLSNNPEIGKQANEIALRIDPNNIFAKENEKIMEGDTLLLLNKLLAAKPPVSLCQDNEPLFDSALLDELFNANSWSMSSEIWRDPLAKSSPESIWVQHADKKGFVVYNVSIVQDGAEKNGLSFFSAKPNFGRKSACGVKINNPSKKLKNRYGEKPKVTHTPNGRFEAFAKDKENGIIFTIDKAELISGWSVYQKF